MDEKSLERIVLDPRIMTGKPVIRGTRIPVEVIVRMVAQRIPDKEILREYPRLQPEDIQAALSYAAASAGFLPSTAVCQNACQVASSKPPRTCSAAQAKSRCSYSRSHSPDSAASGCS